MPLYEFRCRVCDQRFEVRRSMRDAGLVAPCPDGHDDTVRLLSTFATTGTTAAAAAARTEREGRSYTAPMPEETPLDHADPVAVASFRTTGEAEVAQAKLRAYGIEAELNDQIEGGVVLIEGEAGVVVEVAADVAADARAILSDTVDPGEG